MCALIRNVSFCRSWAVSRVLGVNWGTSATQVTWAGIANVGPYNELRRCGQNDASLGPHLDPAGPLRGEEEGHVDVADIDHVQHLASRGQHLARLGDAVLNAAIARRLECAVVDVRLDALDR